MSSPIRWRGVRVCTCIPPIVEAMERELGRSVSVTQGGYNVGGVEASAGTHDKGGVLDLNTSGSDASDLDLVAAGRTVGFWGWIRQPDEGPWPQHWHGIVIGCPHRAPLAVSQEASARRGRDGLRGQGLDPHRALGIPVRSFAEYLEEDVALTDEDISKIGANVEKRLRPSFSTLNQNVWKAIGAARAAEDAAEGSVDAAAIAQSVIDGIGPDLAKQVADEIAVRLKA